VLAVTNVGLASRSDAAIDFRQIANRALSNAYMGTGDADKRKRLGKLNFLCFQVGASRHLGSSCVDDGTAHS
jgi:hypothetical protein